MMRKGSSLPLFLALTFLSPASGSWGQSYQPSKPVELVVHSAAGGGSDVFARAVVEMVQKEKLLPLPLRVVNKTEGASIEALSYMMEKPGDDHTLAIFTNTWVATPLTSKSAKYTAKDLTPLVRLVLEPTIAVVRADSPYKNMNDFVEPAKKRSRSSQTGRRVGNRDREPDRSLDPERHGCQMGVCFNAVG